MITKLYDYENIGQFEDFVVAELIDHDWTPGTPFQVQIESGGFPIEFAHSGLYYRVCDAGLYPMRVSASEEHKWIVTYAPRHPDGNLIEHYRHANDEAATEAIRNAAKAEWADCGIGSYEFWGSKETNVDWQIICDEDAKVEDVSWVVIATSITLSVADREGDPVDADFTATLFDVFESSGKFTAVYSID